MIKKTVDRLNTDDRDKQLQPRIWKINVHAANVNGSDGPAGRVG